MGSHQVGKFGAIPLTDPDDISQSTPDFLANFRTSSVKKIVGSRPIRMRCALASAGHPLPTIFMGHNKRTWTLRKAGSDSWAISYTRRTIVLRYWIGARSNSTLSTMITCHRTFSPVTPCWPCSINYNIQCSENWYILFCCTAFGNADGINSYNSWNWRLYHSVAIWQSSEEKICLLKVFV